jgi:hypothetical protein
MHAMQASREALKRSALLAVTVVGGGQGAQIDAYHGSPRNLHAHDVARTGRSVTSQRTFGPMSRWRIG